jgi:hypothetical protein
MGGKKKTSRQRRPLTGLMTLAKQGAKASTGLIYEILRCTLWNTCCGSPNPSHLRPYNADHTNACGKCSLTWLLSQDCCVNNLACCLYRVGQNHIHTVYIRCFWQGNHPIYGHIRCIYTVLANPMLTASRRFRSKCCITHCARLLSQVSMESVTRTPCPSSTTSFAIEDMLVMEPWSEENLTCEMVSSGHQMPCEMVCSGQRYTVVITCRVRWIALGRVCSGY